MDVRGWNQEFRTMTDNIAVQKKNREGFRSEARNRSSFKSQP